MTAPGTERPMIDFDHHTAYYAENSSKIYAEIREKCPVAYTSAHGGFWLVTRYVDVCAVARDPETFSSRHDFGDGPDRFKGHVIPETSGPLPALPAEIDPPVHNGYRKLLAGHFSAATVARNEAMIESNVHGCIDAVIESGRADLMVDIAALSTTRIILDSMGLVELDAGIVAHPFHELFYTPPGSPEYPSLIAGVHAVNDLFAAAIIERRKRPMDDLVSHLMCSELDGLPLDASTVQGLLFSIIGAGVDSTASTLANAFDYLDGKPEVRRQLVDSPAAMKRACEEFLRYYSTAPLLARTAAQDAQIGDQAVLRGERIALAWAAANRDPEEFENPEVMSLDRARNRHIAFGTGIHRCLGANLARAELASVLSGVLTRMPDYRIDRTLSARYPSTGLVNGWVSLWADFTPGVPRRRSPPDEGNRT